MNIKSLTKLFLLSVSTQLYAGRMYYKKFIAPGTVVRRHNKRVYDKLPIIYSPHYNITFGGLEKLHPFDSKKYGRVYEYLVTTVGIAPECFYRPAMVSDDQLLRVHTQEYIDSLKDSPTVAKIIEMPVGWVPNFLIQRQVLKPMRYAVGGTVLGAQLALEKGWAINLGGGFHHAERDKASGFCVFADAALAISTLWEQNKDLKVMIIDLDAHQGNGNALWFQDEILDSQGNFKQNARIALFDMYNRYAYPTFSRLNNSILKDSEKPVRYRFPLSDYVADGMYLGFLKDNLPKALDEFKPQFIIYNAGTDILAGDPVGRLGVSFQGIIDRDEFVFRQARERNIPILMILSGGYTKQSADVIGKSIKNLFDKRIILK